MTQEICTGIKELVVIGLSKQGIKIKVSIIPNGIDYEQYYNRVTVLTVRYNIDSHQYHTINQQERQLAVSTFSFL